MPCLYSSFGNTLIYISQCRPGTIPSARTATCHINTIQDLDRFSPPPSLTNIWHAHCHVRNTRKAAPPTLSLPPTPWLWANVRALPICADIFGTVWAACVYICAQMSSFRTKKLRCGFRDNNTSDGTHVSQEREELHI